MNKKILVSFLVLIVIAGGGFFAYQMMTNKTTPDNKQNISVNTNENQNNAKTDGEKVLREAILKIEKGEVSLQRGEEIQTIMTSAVLTEGDMVTTKKESEALIVFADDSIVRLSENTQLYLTAVDIGKEEKQIDLMQNFGETWHKVTELMAGDRYTLRYGDTIVGVRGTVFDVKIPEKNKIVVSVISNKVEVADRKINKSKEVTEKTSLLYDQKKPVFQISEELFEDLTDSSWFEENIQADKVVEELEQEVTDLFDYYVDEEKIDLIIDELSDAGEEVKDEVENKMEDLENWWDDAEFIEELPAEYMEQYEEGLKAYEEFVRTMGNMNINWQEYEDALDTLKNLNLNIAIPPEVYDSLNELQNMNFNITLPVIPTIPDASNIKLLDVPYTLPARPTGL